MYDPDEECKSMILSLKRLCEEKNMTPHALAKEAGISTSTISYLMNGKTKPQVYTVLMLCNVLRVRISELFSDNEVFDERKELHIEEVEMPFITYEEEELLNSYRELSDKKRELLRIYVDMLQRYDGNYLSKNDE